MSLSTDIDYYVIKRDGKRAPVRFDSITDRNQTLCSVAYGRRLSYIINKLPSITQKVVQRFKNGMTTHNLDMLTISECAAHSGHHPDYGDLAARIMASNLQKTTPGSMLEMITLMKTFKNVKGNANCRLSAEFISVVERASTEINRRIKDERDFKFTCFGIQQMQTSYLLRNIDHHTCDGGKLLITVERPQFVYMRVALFLNVCQPDSLGHLADDATFNRRLETAFHHYDLLSTFKIVHASPTMFNAGTRDAQLSSCFLLTMDDDFKSIMKTVTDAGVISKSAGGIGIDLSRIRSDGSLINSSGGIATGVTFPLLNLLNANQLYARQLGGRRNGAFAVNMPPWHSDYVEYIRAGRFVGVAKNVPDIKYASWNSDLFMKITRQALSMDDPDMETIAIAGQPDYAVGKWYQFSPDVAFGLVECHGAAFEKLYWELVDKKLYNKVTKPSVIWTEIFKTIVQRGFPYMLYKDNINNRSNLSHDQTIPCSNLCAEITIPCKNYADKADEAEYGTCNLGSVPLASYVVSDATARNNGKVRFDFKSLITNVRFMLREINNVIDMTNYPTMDCKRSNDRYRPIAIGIMGLADVFSMFKYASGDPDALELDMVIQATIYYAAMFESTIMGKEYGNFEAFEGCAAQLNTLQPDMHVRDGYLEDDWREIIETATGGVLTGDMWDTLRTSCTKYLRNGYVTANMPTATSSQVVGQNECFEPYTHQLYTRRTFAGEFIILNRHMQKELEELDMWDLNMLNMIIQAEGSIQNIMSIPEDIRNRYKTAREIDPRILIKHTAVRTPFVSQSQSHNVNLDEVTLENFLTVQMYAWELGCTTGAYYTHTKPASGAIQSAPKPDVDAPKPDVDAPKPDVDTDDVDISNQQMCWAPESFDLGDDGQCTSCST
jgi:ribonucleoside-diphosphate reductase alpha chain